MQKSLTTVMLATGTAVTLAAVGLAAPATAVTLQGTSAGVTMTAARVGLSRIEAQDYSSASGSILVQPSGDSQDPSNEGLALLRRDSQVSFADVEFGAASVNSVDVRLSSAVNSANGKIEIRLGGVNGEIVGSLLVPKTASWQEYKTVSVPLDAPLTGTQKVTLTFSAADPNPFVNVNWFRFKAADVATPTPTPTPT
ncbi:MAG: carbohydrate-binding protein, partial [Actinobacteria bacterium]|nr:carbohydrate-binding protein [Actinomycetota bacterium]